MERDKFIEKAQEVASILGFTFEFNEAFQWARFGKMKRDDVEFSFYNPISTCSASDKNKIIIESIFPLTKDGQCLYSSRDRVRIRVSENKSAAQIAGEIKRRFLPYHMERLQEILKKNQEANEYSESQKNALKKIADHFGWEVDGKRGIIYARISQVYTIESYSKDKVSFKVIATPEQAIKIIEILQGEIKEDC